MWACACLSLSLLALPIRVRATMSPSCASSRASSASHVARYFESAIANRTVREKSSILAKLATLMVSLECLRCHSYTSCDEMLIRLNLCVWSRCVTWCVCVQCDTSRCRQVDDTLCKAALRCICSITYQV